MFEQEDKTKIIMTSLGGVFIVAIVGVAVLVLEPASQLQAAQQAKALVALGSLQLLEISKSPLQDGNYLMQLEAKPGLSVYGAVWVLVGVLVAVARIRTIKD